MFDYTEFDTSPVEEDCVQVNQQGDYHDKMQEEADHFKALMEARFADRPEGTYFRIKWNNHDFGSYAGLRFYYDADDPEHHDYMLHVDGNMPDRWTDTAPCPMERKARTEPAPEKSPRDLLEEMAYLEDGDDFEMIMEMAGL